MSRRSIEDQYWEEPRRGLAGWFFWVVFKAPGKMILWWEYMYPKRGQVYASGRRYGNPVVEVITSIGFWFTMAYVALLLTHPRVNNPPPHLQSATQNIPDQRYRSMDVEQPASPPANQAPSTPDIQLPEENDPAGIPPEQIVIVTAFANLRAMPSRNAALVGQANVDEQLALIKLQGSWAEVRRENSTVVWIHRSLIAPAR